MRLGHTPVDPPAFGTDNHRMTRSTRFTLPLAASAALAGLVSCSLPTRSQPEAPGVRAPSRTTSVPASTTISEARRMQSEVMDFADDLTVRLAEAIDDIEGVAPTIEARVMAHRIKYTVAHGATIIAAAQNPRIALVDMMVMISLQRTLIERNIVPGRFGAEADRLRAVFESSEAEIRRLASAALTPEQLAEIDGLVKRWLEENTDRRYAAYVRLSDFAESRQITTGKNAAGRPSNVLGLLFLDPLSSLDPTTREIEQTRLFAERALYFLQRVPVLVSWQAELLFIDTVSEPEMRRLAENAATTAESVARVTDEFAALRAQIPELIASERAATMDRVATIADEQRRAGIDQALEGLRAEREATILQLADEQERLGAAIADLHAAIESGTALSESLGRTASGFTELAQKLGLDEPRAPGSEPFRIQNYTEAIREAAHTAERLNELTASLVAATSSEVLESRLTLLEQRLQGAERSADRFLNRAFRLAMLLIIALVSGLASVVVLAAVLARRRQVARPA